MPVHPRSASVLDDFRAYVTLTGSVSKENLPRMEKTFMAIWTSLEQGTPPELIHAKLHTVRYWSNDLLNLTVEAFTRTSYERVGTRNRRPVKTMWMRQQHACFSIGVFIVPIRMLISVQKKFRKQQWYIHSNRGFSYLCDGTLELGASASFSSLDFSPNSPTYR